MGKQDWNKKFGTGIKPRSLDFHSNIWQNERTAIVPTKRKRVCVKLLHNAQNSKNQIKQGS